VFTLEGIGNLISNTATYEEVIRDTKFKEWVFDFCREIWTTTPESRYQELKKHRYAHDPFGGGWYAHGRTGPNGEYIRSPCEGEKGCVPECRYHREIGRIEDLEVLRGYEDYEGYIEALRQWQGRETH
jgi:hypothetical protein